MGCWVRFYKLTVQTKRTWPFAVSIFPPGNLAKLLHFSLCYIYRLLERFHRRTNCYTSLSCASWRACSSCSFLESISSSSCLLFSSACEEKWERKETMRLIMHQDWHQTGFLTIRNLFIAISTQRHLDLLEQIRDNVSWVLDQNKFWTDEKVL